MRLPALALFTALGALPLAAQAPAYVPRHHWAVPYVEHLIARGVVVDPSPLSRPFRRADLLAALEAADTAAMGDGSRLIVRAIVADLGRPAEHPTWRIDAHAGVAGATHARRDPLREAGTGHATFAGGLGLWLELGSVAVVTHPYFDTRLKYDPDYQGKKDRVVAGRNAEAYIAARWKYADLFFGSVDRDWGSPSLDGLVLSSAPYSYDHFALGVGTANVRLEAVITQLDDLPDTLAVPNHRYWVAHRLLVRPPGATTITLWEGTIVAGEDRELEPWYANVFNLGLLAQYDQGSAANSLLGADVESRVGRVRVFGSLLLDDIQVDDDTPGDDEPVSYGLSAGVDAPLGPAVLTAFYTRVTNLTYRTPNPVEAVMRRGVGLARNFSDYDQITVRSSLLAGPAVLLSPEVTLLRQGEGDFRLPYPPVAAYGTTPVFLDGVVERTIRLALAARADTRRWSISADAGIHLIDNLAHVSGDTESRFVGSVAVTYRFDWQGALP